MRDDITAKPRQPAEPIPFSARRASAAALLTLVWIVVSAAGLWLVDDRSKTVPLAFLGVFGLSASLLAVGWCERKRWREPINRIGDRIDALSQNPSGDFRPTCPSGFEHLVESLERLARQFKRLDSGTLPTFTSPGDSGNLGPSLLAARGGLFERTSDSFDVAADPLLSREYSTSEMVNRLDPRLFRWLESSVAEQSFLGWTVQQLREKSFLEIVHPDDLERVRESLRQVLVKGDVHGLIFRLRTAYGKQRAVAMNAGARYNSDMSVSHVRCHLADVTSKVRAEREQRLRTRELTQVNDQLRLINRELEELKERYRDLYENAPTMYFSLDGTGRFIECNETLARTLGYDRDEVVGKRYDFLLPESQASLFDTRFARFLEAGTIEVSSRWVKAKGEIIDVWVTGTAVRDASGRILHSRSVAQDVTARVRLEAELHEKNERLARTIDELSRRNQELDEFTYVVSHDLQEPIRTLNAFSDFLLNDHGDRLDEAGREYVVHIMDAARRMRALILDLMDLSRAGKVTAEFATVNLEEMLGVIRADLKELIRSKGADLRVTPLPAVWGDRARLGQLFANLIANGLKYNADTSPVVEIGAMSPEPERDSSTSSTVTIYVRDNGIGIDPKFHRKVFQLFKRLHARDEYEGNGAGLAISAKIAQAHGGRIWVESEPGQGAIFFVSLPSSPAVATATDSQYP
jgi:PAS domain S-box-containing protein